MRVKREKQTVCILSNPALRVLYLKIVLNYKINWSDQVHITYNIMYLTCTYIILVNEFELILWVCEKKNYFINNTLLTIQRFL